MDRPGRSLARGRARGLGLTPPEANIRFFQGRGVGARHPGPVPPPPVPMEMDDPDVIRQEEPGAMMEEDVVVPQAAGAGAASPGSNGSNGSGSGSGNESNGSPNGSNGNGNGSNGNGSGSNGNGNGNGSSEEESVDESSTEDQSRSDETATTGGNGRGIRPDILDYVLTRPTNLATKQGTSGQAIQLVANYFMLQHRKNWQLRQYRVDVRPEEDQTKVRKQLVRQHREVLPAHIFDGTVLISYEALTPEPLLLNSEHNGTQYVVEIRLVREFATGDPMTNQFYNLVVRKTLQALELDLLRRHYYDSRQSIALPNWRLELWPGFITSMRKCEEDVLLNVEVTHKMIRKDNVLHLMETVRRDCRGGIDEMRAQVSQLLVGRIVITLYNRKTYRIDGIDWNTKADGSFPKRVGDNIQMISFREYYQKRYNVNLTDRNQPLLISKPRERQLHDLNRDQDQKAILLIPELCFITGLDEDQRANFQLMKDMSQHLHMVPGRRLQTLRTFMDRIRNTRAIVEDMTNWGIRFPGELTNVPGRVLEGEVLQFGGGKGQNYKADWSIAFRSMQVFSTPQLRVWCLVVPQRFDKGVDNLIQTMQRVSRPLNYQISNPELIRIPQDRPGAYVDAIDNAMTKYQDKMQMMFFILPNPRIDLYSTIKKRISIDYGVPSQCFLTKTVQNKGLMSIATKVVIQMCAKQGGEPWSVINPLKNLMIVGFDVYHSAGRKDRSVGAMVSSYSHTLARYFSTISHFSSRDEMAENMGKDIMKCLRAYKQTNNVFPARIMFYRDGVGEGQLSYVYTSELEQMKGVIQSVYHEAGQEMAKLTYVVVNKKINTRLIYSAPGKCDNPPPGTVVDSVVTLPERYDFFLISQSVRQGTVSPCSYNVLFDESRLPADKLQIFTYKLCHLYFNWSGTVAVPAPCQYAHKLAYLTGLALGAKANQKLQFLLHYL